MWDAAHSASLLLKKKELFEPVWKVNEWMKTGEIPEFNRDTKLEDEMTGAAFLSFLTYLRVFLRKKRLNLNDVIILNFTSNFDGVRCFKSSTANGEVYIWYVKVIQLGKLCTKEENIIILAVLEKKKDTPFSDDLLIPLYSQFFKLGTEGVKRKVFGGEKHYFMFFTLFANDLPINRFLLGIEGHGSCYGCGKCLTKAVSGTSSAHFFSFSVHSL